MNEVFAHPRLHVKTYWHLRNIKKLSHKRIIGIFVRHFGNNETSLGKHQMKLVIEDTLEQEERRGPFTHPSTKEAV
jgi:hypothetical protein